MSLLGRLVGLLFCQTLGFQTILTGSGSERKQDSDFSICSALDGQIVLACLDHPNNLNPIFAQDLAAARLEHRHTRAEILLTHASLVHCRAGDNIVVPCELLGP